MQLSLLTAVALVALLWTPLAAGREAASDTGPFECNHCAEWNAPMDPFRIHDGVYYVGTRGLSSILIDSGEDLILLDGGLPQSAQSIIGSIRELGFDPRKVRWIVNSHEHFDHAGGIAALSRLTGAQVAASPRGAEALRTGVAGDDDPQSGYGPARFPRVGKVREMADGESIELGQITLTAWHTPGHAPGATTWTWRNCEIGHQRCLEFVYADSLNPVSAPGFRFGDDADRVKEFEASLAKLRALPCDVLIPLHPDFKHAHATATAFVGKDKCAAFVKRVETRWQQRLRDERNEQAQPRNSAAASAKR